MKNYKGTLLLLFLGMAVATATAMMTLQGRGQTENKVNLPGGQPPREEIAARFPTVNFETQEPDSPEERAKRSEKSRRYNIPNGVKFNPSSPIDRGVLHNNWEWGLTSSLPADQSSAVIVGEVTDAQAYLSEDKRNVYSEFTVRVEEVLKNDSKEPIDVGGLAVTERQGGRVRFPSGRVERQQVAGQAAPQIGRRYVLFLGFNPHEASTKKLTGPRGDMRRHILTGYELREGKVFPLDVLGDFRVHEGKDVTTFLNDIRALIADASQPTPE